ncbi:hypothetical protein SRCM100730_00001 [Bacillus velezensis]|uniref:hypothetical protein n=1 Tax=Bacillus subtilis group TaxID=653685 RepID=UPI0007F88ADE|nr:MULTISPECIES: hypothetical protein [Bacillus subtilis group]MEC0446179.1 hypothetical protein [Bacillus velezensis]OBR34628.1 hypothetical protein SRCM100731_00824 [Bacillus velezensis]OCB99862.1 hypothetical protein SRCM100730_00001 [Bacillus velezensis]RHJ09036.1 hypothetical protein DW143_13750 [Bacillus sonorensis]WPP36685.1 hypothetical protein SK061_24490 [Bacillus sonorensis]
MDSIDIFRRYLKEHHPSLVSKDWLVNVEIMEQGDIVNQELKEIVPKQVQNLRCLVFFYIGGEDKNVVYLFQDERGIKSWAIALVRNDELVHAITL